MIVNAFNVLANKGFLRDQGILTLEVVQEFYKLIRSRPQNAKMITQSLLSYCGRKPLHVSHSEVKDPDIDSMSQHRPVMTLMKKCKTLDKATGQQIFNSFYHAVALKSFVRNGNSLTLRTIDSLSGADDDTTIECTVSVDDRGNELLETCNDTEKWCLGHDICYYFELQ